MLWVRRTVVTEVKLSDIVYVNEIVDFINDQVKRDHLDYDIKLISTHNKIKVALHESDYFWWSRVVKKIHLIYGDKVNLTTYHPDVNIPTIHVQAIWYGNNPFIILVNGKRYYEQSQLNEQWELKAITDNHIVITDNIKTIEIRHEDL